MNGAETAEDLKAARIPFVAATVVRAERPTSAKPGDAAIVLADGRILGFVGGECAEASVQAEALSTLARGEPVLLRITPDADATAGAAGTVTVHNPCLSGGTLDIFLEPVLPPPLVVVHGDAPIAQAVAALAERIGYAVVSAGEDSVPVDAAAVIVASHGRGEAAVLRAALGTPVPYIGLVASRRRGEGVLGALELSGAERARIRSPAGLDIGARTPEEVALSILADVVASRPRRDREADSPAEVAAAVTATDPVCGMTVAAVEAGRRLDHEGRRFWFCGPGCQDAFAANPEAFLTR
jgi:xanthine dehydrogenase accessory factor